MFYYILYLAENHVLFYPSFTYDSFFAGHIDSVLTLLLAMSFVDGST